MIPAREEAEEYWEKRWIAKSEHSSDQSDYTHQSSSLNKKNETNEGEYATIWWCHGSQHEGTKVPDWSQKFEKFADDEVYSDFDETEEESAEDDNDTDYDQVPITRKF